MRQAPALLFALVLLVPWSAHAAVLRVSPDGSGDYPTIQAAVAAAVDGDVVELAAGVYRGAGNRDVFVESQAIAIRSRDGDPATCVLDCERAGRGFQFSSVSTGTRLEAVTIRNGFADQGGGLWTYGDAQIRDCVFEDNHAAESGGGMACFGSLTVERCTFVNNDAGDAGGGVMHGSAGAFDAPRFSDCSFIGNAAQLGGGFYIELVSPLRQERNLERCLLAGNRARDGAALFVSGCSPQIDRCTFVANEATNGGTLACDFGAPLLRTSILAFASQGAAVRCTPAAIPGLSCCDIFGNAGGDWVGEIAPQAGTSGNISADPLFCDREGGAYRLAADSPCAPENDPICGLRGALDVGCGPSPALETSWGAIKAIFAR